jgi:hypothetical protein
MNVQERVRAALHQREPDRVSIWELGFTTNDKQVGK